MDTRIEKEDIKFLTADDSLFASLRIVKILKMSKTLDDLTNPLFAAIHICNEYEEWSVKRLFYNLFDSNLFNIFQEETIDGVQLYSKFHLDCIFKMSSLTRSHYEFLDDDGERQSDNILVVELKPLQLSNSLFTYQSRDMQDDILIRYGWKDIKGFMTSDRSSSPDEDELHFYDTLHKIFFMCYQIQQCLQEDVKWSFWPFREESQQILKNLGSWEEMIDEGGISKTFIAKMTPKLKALMENYNYFSNKIEYPIGHILISDLILQKLSSRNKYNYLIPNLFDDAGSYMYILCGDATQCRCDLMVNYGKNFQNSITCDNIDRKLKEYQTTIIQSYEKEEAIRQYMMSNIRGNESFEVKTVSALLPFGTYNHSTENEQTSIHIDDDNIENCKTFWKDKPSKAYLKSIASPENLEFDLTLLALSAFKKPDSSILLEMESGYGKGGIRRAEINEYSSKTTDEKLMKMLKNEMSEEFMLLIQGKEMNIDDILESIQPTSGIHEMGIIMVIQFVRLLTSLTNEEIILFVEFTTGIPAIPSNFQLQINQTPYDGSRLWSGHTCFNSVEIATTFKEFVDKMLFDLTSYDDSGDQSYLSDLKKEIGLKQSGDYKPIYQNHKIVDDFMRKYYTDENEMLFQKEKERFIYQMQEGVAANKEKGETCSLSRSETLVTLLHHYNLP